MRSQIGKVRAPDLSSTHLGTGPGNSPCGFGAQRSGRVIPPDLITRFPAPGRSSGKVQGSSPPKARRQRYPCKVCIFELSMLCAVRRGDHRLVFCSLLQSTPGRGIFFSRVSLRTLRRSDFGLFNCMPKTSDCHSIVGPAKALISSRMGTPPRTDRLVRGILNNAASRVANHPLPSYVT